MTKAGDIIAIVLGAGLSTRMGREKLLLPWKNTTILGNIVSTLTSAGIQDIIVVIRSSHDQLSEYILFLSWDHPVRFVINDSFNPDDMLTSIQYGLKAINSSTTSTLIVLGDQPQIEAETIRQIIDAHQQTKEFIVIPSYALRRGHPWLIPAPLISQFIQLQFPLTPRDFLEQHKEEISYVIIENDSILKDIDTPDDYQTHKPIQ
ncbi:MAG: nucleotidyltransferase family protein [Chloroflexota bacterium]